MAPVYDDIRKAIEASGKTRYRLSKETGIGEPQLCRFMQGINGLSVEAMERLAACLDLEIVARPKKRRQKRDAKKRK